MNLIIDALTHRAFPACAVALALLSVAVWVAAREGRAG